VFVRRHGPDKHSPRDLAWVRLSDGHVEVLPSKTEEMWPYWSDVVKRVVFLRGYEGRRRGRLWIWDPATGQQQPVSGVNNRWESWADWSPSDPLLAYSTLKHRHGGIEVQDLTTGRRTVVAPTVPGDSYLRPSFGPRRDLLVAQRMRQHDSDLFLLHEDRPPEPLVVDPDGLAEKPVFRRDGGAVLYSSGPPEGGPEQLYEVDLASRAIRPLAPDPAESRHTVAVSPARDEIAFVSERDRRSDLWVMTLPDGPARRLTDTPDWDEYAPQWSPDGELLALTGGPDGALLRVIDRSGTVRFETAGFSPDWMPPPVAAPAPQR
jgi:Tol biopolymer transport system component